MRVRNDFDRIAPYYDLLARMVFRQCLLESQSLFLPLIPAGSKILILGGGTGRILPTLLNRNPEMITYLEPSEKMLALARTQVSSQSKVNFVKGSFQNLPINELYDIIITPFVLDIFSFPELRQCMVKLSSVLSLSGAWIFTDFHISSSTNRFWQVPLVNLMYWFFRISCNIGASRLLDFHELFAANRLSPEASSSFLGGAIISRIYRFKEQVPFSIQKFP